MGDPLPGNTRDSSTEKLPILWRTDSPLNQYDEARCRVFNGRRPEHFPRAIVQATTLDHIVAAVRLAVESAAPVAVRSGGHSLSCWTMRHDAILIDLKDFSYLSYDEETHQVQASPSTLTGELLEFLAQKQRFFPVGHSGGIGLGGYLLQAGIGLNCRGYGYACESVSGIDIVTADGCIKHCDKEENADLYWAARGAGPEFPAIVTRFYLETRPMPVCNRSTYIWPATMYDQVFPWLDRVSSSCPCPQPSSRGFKLLTTLDENVEVGVFGFTVPQLNQPGLHVLATAFGDSDEDTRRMLTPFIDTHPPGAIHAQDFVAADFASDYVLDKTVLPQGARYFTDSVFLKPGTDLVVACKDMFTGLKHPRALAYWQPMKTATARTLPDMAMSIHSDHYVSLLGIYDDSAQDDEQTSWIVDYMRKLEPFVLGTFVGDAHVLERPSNYWSEEAKERVLRVGKKWDPSGRIRGMLLSDS
uniref:JtmO n=1 Tax=Epichloe sp. LpTG-4 TaxID=1648837 RepID=A0A650FYW1_9HYPO|nr:JtmO [Epichloe sp. LpTG-4]